MCIDGNARTWSNYICFRIYRPNFIEIDDPIAVTFPCQQKLRLNLYSKIYQVKNYMYVLF